MSGIGMAMILQEQVEQWTPVQLEARMDLLIDQAGRAGLSLGWMAEARAVLAELKSRRLKASAG